MYHAGVYSTFTFYFMPIFLSKSFRYLCSLSHDVTEMFVKERERAGKGWQLLVRREGILVLSVSYILTFSFTFNSIFSSCFDIFLLAFCQVWVKICYSSKGVVFFLFVCLYYFLFGISGIIWEITSAFFCFVCVWERRVFVVLRGKNGFKYSWTDRLFVCLSVVLFIILFVC